MSDNPSRRFGALGRHRRIPLPLPPNRVPWRFLTAASLAALILLKVLDDASMCAGESRWAAANAVMLVIEFVALALLFHRSIRVRRVVALTLTAVMFATGCFAVGAHAMDVSLADCGCFGPIELPWWGHAFVGVSLALLYGGLWLDLERRSSVTPPS